MVGCGSNADQQLIRIVESLELTIVHARFMDSREAIELEMSLRNKSQAAAVACLGPGRIVASSTGAVEMTMVDHPGCLREFTILPGKTMKWSERFEAETGPDCRDVNVDVEIEVEVVNPRRCGSVGCSSTWLKSARRRLQPPADPKH